MMVDRVSSALQVCSSQSRTSCTRSTGVLGPRRLGGSFDGMEAEDGGRGARHREAL